VSCGPLGERRRGRERRAERVEMGEAKTVGCWAAAAKHPYRIHLDS
jgi:hypothetical protein